MPTKLGREPLEPGYVSRDTYSPYFINSTLTGPMVDCIDIAGISRYITCGAES